MSYIKGSLLSNNSLMHFSCMKPLPFRNYALVLEFNQHEEVFPLSLLWLMASVRKRTN